MKLGSGWKHVGGAVYDHPTGLRVHVMGICRLASGDTVDGMRWPESDRLNRFARINGSNRKRGAMAWALSVARESNNQGCCDAGSHSQEYAS